MQTKPGSMEFRRQGEPLEAVKTERHEIQLLARGDGTEVMRYVLRPGARFVLEPDPGWAAMEFLTVLSGRLRWKRDAGETLLHPGDTLAGAPVDEICSFLAEVPTVLLYVSSRPVFHQYSRVYRDLQEMAVAVEEKDGYTRSHCERIRELAASVGERLQLPPARLHLLQLGAFLHDLGKVAVPAEILGKPGKLTPAEWSIMKQHPVLGANMVEGTWLKGIAPILAQHHERLDGSGYPLGLQGEEICLEAQIVAVVDSYDAMTSRRVYHEGIPRAEAVAELRRCAGRLYRRDVVEAFLAVLDSHLDTV